MFELIAQTPVDATGFSPGSWATLIGSIGVPGILMWFLWYETAVARPKREEEARKQQEEARKAHELISDKFSDTVREVTETFTTELQEERKSREKIAETFRCAGMPARQ